MGLRDWFQKRDRMSQLSIELQEAIAERDELQRNCQQLERQCEDALAKGSMEQHLRKEALEQVACLSSLFKRFCTQQPTVEQLYCYAAPYLDPDGFRLYAAACHVTDINIHNYFHYEENCGMLETMLFADMLRYLEAAHFDAITWEIVPGTTYEEAILETIDTSTPEYKAYREKVFEDALGCMGLGDILPRKEKETKEVEHER